MKQLDTTKKEKEIYEFWEKEGFFASKPDSSKKSYSIVIPPPNVTGALHMGHALNNTIQDLLIRYHRMAGFNACWLPGTDHAGIATQSVVEKKLMQEEKKSRHDIGRDAMTEKIWEWVKTYGDRIILQLKTMGCSCDWERQAFTLNEDLSYAVKYVFNDLYHEGLVYRGKRLINWCPGCRTALSNDELEHEEHDAFLWDIKYKIEGPDKDAFIVVSTTRPETMLGDTAIAVNSKDERYKKYVGKNCFIPIINKKIPIITDDILVDMTVGTGAVKVTPGHDPNDFACGQRNKLPIVNILNEDGTLNDNAGPYKGLKILDARNKLLADIKQQDLYAGEKKIKHNVAHCYRSDDVVEPFISSQWFVKMAPLVKMALKVAEENKVEFTPKEKKADYVRWLENTPDWCISRQIWWGHRINVWYCIDCNKIELKQNGEPISIPEEALPILPDKKTLDTAPTKCPQCSSSKLVQDPYVLDTWFSSQLWPLSTFGWPKENLGLNYYYPTAVLCTARDILALWVARMIMMGMKYKNEVPFKDVYIHATVLDDKGDIMSKSRGNGIDPMTLIEGGETEINGKYPVKDAPAQRTEVWPTYGADAVRFALMYMIIGNTQDAKFLINRTKRADGKYEASAPKVEEAMRFGQKILQAVRGLIFANCEKGYAHIQDLRQAVKDSTSPEDKWLYSRLIAVSNEVAKNYENYEFGIACNTLYHFFWDEFCSYYLEMVKVRLWGKVNSESEMLAKNMLIHATDVFVRMLHPVMPYLTEELFQELKTFKEKNNAGTTEKACIVATYPRFNLKDIDEQAILINENVRKIITTLNSIRAESNITKEVPELVILSRNNEMLENLKFFSENLKRVLKVQTVAFVAEYKAEPKTAARVLANDLEIFVPLKDLIDTDAERTRLNMNLEKLVQKHSGLQKRLGDSKYMNNAPAHIVEDTKRQFEETAAQIKLVEEKIKLL